MNFTEKKLCEIRPEHGLVASASTLVLVGLEFGSRLGLIKGLYNGTVAFLASAQLKKNCRKGH